MDRQDAAFTGVGIAGMTALVCRFIDPERMRPDETAGDPAAVQVLGVSNVFASRSSGRADCNNLSSSTASRFGCSMVNRRWATGGSGSCL